MLSLYAEKKEEIKKQLLKLATLLMFFQVCVKIEIIHS